MPWFAATMRQRRSWRPLGYATIVAVSLGLNSWGVTSSGWGAAYYAAAVRSMGTSWHNFFFASFDPTGFVSVDKPPLSLWVQVVFTKVFGYAPWALYAPQVIAGTLAVAVLMVGLRRAIGPWAAITGGAALALTPISVMVNRSNNTDSPVRVEEERPTSSDSGLPAEPLDDSGSSTMPWVPRPDGFCRSQPLVQ